MTATLNTKPGSSSKLAHQTLVIEGKRRGFDLAEIRKMVGGSICRLSAADCSVWIKHFSGRDLPNPPGQKPRPCDRKGKSTGATRMITADQVHQIGRLGFQYFGDTPPLLAWLSKNFKIPLTEVVNVHGFGNFVRQLSTAKRAGEVIRVLKSMHARRKKKETAQ